MARKRRPIANLPRGIGLGQNRDGKGRLYWRVRLGKKFTGGRARTKDFKKLADASDWIDQQKPNREKMVASGMSPAHLAEATDALARLEGKGTLTEAVSFFLKHANPGGGNRTLDEVAKEFISNRITMGVRPRTLTQYESYIRVIGGRFGGDPVSTIRRAEIEDWLAESEWSARTRNNYLSTLSTLLLFARDRDYCAENAADKVPRAILDDKPPGILTTDQAADILRTARDQFPELVAYLAIGLFAGLRRSELCALEWNEVDRESGMIEIKGVKAKTRQRRVVSIAPVLEEWLLIAEMGARPAPSTNEDVCGERLKTLVLAANVRDYPHNALRHSYGSYHFAEFQNEQLTAAQMGNSPAVVFKHYRAVVSSSKAKAFWNLAPKKV